VPDPSQLPHLLKLLDDDSPAVRASVAEALRAFGPSLTQQLGKLNVPPDEAQAQMIRELLSASSVPRGESPSTERLFETGQLVRHRRYDYRGVVVSLDPTCQAQDEWYFSNNTQPDRYQPWYHVLVHDTQQVTYPAQSSLQADDSGEQIVHPLLTDFFSAFTDGKYLRNDRPWPT
jgi:heat shock protein HspQ